MRVRHHTGFRYESDVHASYNEARLTPADTAHAAASSSTGSTCDPGAALMRYRDYWGTIVHTFDLQRAAP